MRERERQLTVTFGFPVFGTEDQAHQTIERVRRLLSVELSRAVELVTLEMNDDDAGGPDEDTPDTGLHPTGDGAVGSADAAAGDESGAAGGA